MVKLYNSNLCTEQSEDAEEEKQQNEEGGDGFNGGDQRLEQILEGFPITSHLRWEGGRDQD